MKDNVFISFFITIGLVVLSVFLLLLLLILFLFSEKAYRKAVVRFYKPTMLRIKKDIKDYICKLRK